MKNEKLNWLFKVGLFLLWPVIGAGLLCIFLIILFFCWVMIFPSQVTWDGNIPSFKFTFKSKEDEDEGTD